MSKNSFFKSNTVGGLLANFCVALCVIGIVAIIYFYIYLPNITNHGKTIPVPDLKGLSVADAEKILAEKMLRLAVNDSSYLEDAEPLSILKQYPAENEEVKENRTIFVSINRATPTTLPVPDLVDRSLINAEVVLRSNELRIGKIDFSPSPFRNLVIEMRYKGQTIRAGTRVFKGATIDLVVGDGFESADLVVGNLVGDTYQTALIKLSGWNLHLGNVEIPRGQDTTGVVPIVYKQMPLPGDSVRGGEPVHLWIARKGYKEQL